MSSEAEGLAVVAVGIAAPIMIAAGAGWLAWKTGQVIADGVRSVNRQIENEKLKAERKAYQRLTAAKTAHSRLTEMCAQVLARLEKDKSIAEIEALKVELRKICSEHLPNDAERIESITASGYLTLERIIGKHERIAAFELEASKTGLHSSCSVAGLMKGLRTAVAAMQIQATDGKDVVADAEAVERAELNGQLFETAARLVAALEESTELAKSCGLDAAGTAWLHACFFGTDEIIEKAYLPESSNGEIKKCIKRLQAALEQYDMLSADFAKRMKRMAALYDAYIKGCIALGEEKEALASFKSPEEIEERLRYLEKRAEKARECAKVHSMLGESAYICYAWDQELQALGYKVYSKKAIEELALAKPENAKKDGMKMPFYEWQADKLTQLYSMAGKCSLQVVVDKDGSVFMQTVSDDGSDETVAAQRNHCKLLKILHEKLKENWFITYKYEETASPEQVKTLSTWRSEADASWGESEVKEEEKSKTEKSALKAKEKK